MADYTQSTVGRTAAVLTTGEVAGNTLNLLSTKPHEAQLCVDIDFTVGSLTDCTFRCYASMDGTTFDLIYVGATAAAAVLTADDTICITLPSLAGYKYFRVSAQGSGTVTSSSAAFTYRWLRRGSQI